MVLVIAALCAASCPAAAMAADPAGTPSGKVLRDTYPLHTRPQTRAPDPTAAPGSPADRRGQVPPPKTDESNATPPLAILIILALGVLAFWLLRRRTAGGKAPPENPAGAPTRRPGVRSPALFQAVQASQSAEPARAPRPGDDRRRGAERAIATREESPERAPGRFSRAQGAAAVELPDPARRWTAEIAWRDSAGASRFVVCAQAGRGAEAVVVESEPVRWPPAGAEDVAALERIVSGLEEKLLDAGWTALEPGDVWYARRLAWSPRAPARRIPPTPAPAAPAPTPTVAELQRRFTQGSAATWNCEIQWRCLSPGWGFRACADSAQLRCRRVIAESVVFPTPADRDTPAGRGALDGLIAALTEAGWVVSESETEAVWTRDDEPQQLPPLGVAQFTERNQT